jgi:hypothetical protein
MSYYEEDPIGDMLIVIALVVFVAGLVGVMLKYFV